MNKKIGKQTVKFENPPVITSVASVVGKKESEGPLGECFDVVSEDAYFNEDSWEKAESRITRTVFQTVINKRNMDINDIDYIIGGDLLNQCTATTFGIRDFKLPFFGVYGACSTMGESMSIAAMLIDGGFGKNIAAGATSHFCSAEKQFRFPLPLGTQRPPSSTWTVTGGGAVIISSEGNGPVITHVTTGKIVDLGVNDANNMGAAMAPAAADLIITHFKDTGRKADDYDIIATGDLGYIGRELVVDMVSREGYVLGDNFTDCGIKIFDKETQDTHAGGSGCACSAVTYCGYFHKMLVERRINRMLFIPTGALLSTLSSQQGETIPGIAHGIVIEAQGRKN